MPEILARVGDIPVGIVVFVVMFFVFGFLLWYARRLTINWVTQQFLDGHQEEGMPKVREHKGSNEHGPFC